MSGDVEARKAIMNEGDNCLKMSGRDGGELFTQGNVGEVSLVLSDDLCGEMRKFCVRENTTAFLTLVTAFRALLFRYNIVDDIGVHEIGEERCLAYKVALDHDVTGNTTFKTLLQYVKADVIAGNKLICNSVGDQCCERNITSERIAFIMQHGDQGIAAVPFVENYDLSLVVAADTFRGVIRYNADAYADVIVQRMAAHFRQLVCAVVEKPYLPIGAIDILTAGEKHELVHVFNDTVRPYDTAQTVVSLFEEQAERTPHNTAIFDGELTVSYEELNRRANQLARHLIFSGVKPQDNVALLVNRRADMIVGMYAILKAGAAYVPITPSTPADRQKYVLDQSGVQFVLANVDHTLAEVPGIAAVDMRTVAYAQYSGENPRIAIDGHQLAYTIYTSGSTGVPKGVMIEHHSVVNLVQWVNAEFNVSEGDRLLFVTSMGFDLSVYDIFGILAVGGAIVMAQKEDIPNVTKVAELLKKYEVTFWDSVPSTMEFLVNKLIATDKEYRQTSLRLVFLSGDWIPVSLPGKITRCFPDAKVISLGGATEGTVWSNYFPIDEVDPGWRSIPYGRPITNNAFYILNDQLQPVPHGVAGELYIGGVGVAKGYAGDAEKTAGSFVADPFTTQWGGRMYRTGDLGRMLPGNIMEFIGRKDSQVKIRGHRVELGEIESVVRQCGSVAHACVLLSQDRQQLRCYVVPGMYYDRDTVIAFVKNKLPDYMVPAKWVEIEQMPLTANGKTDIKALLHLDEDGQPRREFVVPRNDTERQMVEVWQEVLGVDAVGVHDNFFDLGGQSLLAVELITEMEQRIGKQLPVNILYNSPTIAEINTYLEKAGKEKKWKSLLAVKESGTKMPIYIVAGDGLSLSNFQALSAYVDNDQPVYSLQPIGLNGVDEPLENIADIARHYIAEIMEHNPAGPYALGGYSFGGYVAIEMRRQLEEMGKEVKMVAIFDTDAKKLSYKKTTLPTRIKRQVPKFIFIAKSMLTRPLPTLKYQVDLFSRKFNELSVSLGIKEKPELKGINKWIDNINESNIKAFTKYQLTPFDGKVHLFKAQYRLYFVDDFDYLGWASYARAGVEVYDVPGDHGTMFNAPHVHELGRALQHALDNC